METPDVGAHVALIVNLPYNISQAVALGARAVGVIKGRQEETIAKSQLLVE
jgi:hypothetical protein